MKEILKKLPRACEDGISFIISSRFHLKSTADSKIWT